MNEGLWAGIVAGAVGLIGTVVGLIGHVLNAKLQLLQANVMKMQTTMQQLHHADQMALQRELKLVELQAQLSLQQAELQAAEVARAREQLRSLVELSSRVETSISRLVQMSDTLDDSRMMLETANTLAIVADFFNRTGDEARICLPRQVGAALITLRNAITSVFLGLEWQGDARREPSTIAELGKRLIQLRTGVQALHDEVHPFVMIQLTPLAAPLVMQVNVPPPNAADGAGSSRN
jgi:multidrug efflux pump subunit AcrA (membrane-fusion protein)